MVTLIFVAASTLMSGGPVFAKEKLAIWLGYGETLPAFEFVKAEFEKKFDLCKSKYGYYAACFNSMV
ncbi:MAG: hypothetical protein RBT80_15700 [Candidatus Vecturithrix sp.]|jgi:hypothetical protein|nr:hypothetical protein [Candidatus Vecturithrix sp.]